MVRPALPVHSPVGGKAPGWIDQTPTASRILHVRKDHMSATEPSYILSSRAAYFFSTTLRLTFRLGVSSPSSTDRSLGRIANCLTVSYLASVLLTSSKYGSMSF